MCAGSCRSEGSDPEPGRTMSSSGCRKVVFVFLLLSCLLLLFFVYYQPKATPPTSDRTCPLCPAVQCTQNRDSSPNCSSEKDAAPRHGDAPTTRDPELDTVLLIWKWPFGQKFDLGCEAFNVSGCRLTDDRSLYPQAHGVFFHHRDIGRNPVDLPREPRPSFQMWVWSNMESPSNSAPVPELDDVFNLTCTYHLDSDIPVPYGYLVPLTAEDEPFKLPAKNKLVCWIVTNWNPEFKRSRFYEELKQHVKISCYGDTFNRHLNDKEYHETVSSCKFYLSFENSLHRDYITEKLYRPMMLGSVPVVMGPPRKNYEDHIPADSFIHVDDFHSPKELAQRLLYLDQNQAEYIRYLNWKNTFKVQRSWFGKEHVCKTCGYLRNHRGQRVVHGLNKWYWG